MIYIVKTLGLILLAWAIYYMAFNSGNNKA